MSTKDERIYIRLSADVKDDFKKVADLRGLKPSTLIHSLIVKTIREEKRDNPEAFINSTGGKELAPNSKEKIPMPDTSKTKKDKAA